MPFSTVIAACAREMSALVHSSKQPQGLPLCAVYHRGLNRMLITGTRLGPYEILAAIGAGGPASVRGRIGGELRRGLAEAKPETR